MSSTQSGSSSGADTNSNLDIDTTIAQIRGTVIAWTIVFSFLTLGVITRLTTAIRRFSSKIESALDKLAATRRILLIQDCILVLQWIAMTVMVAWEYILLKQLNQLQRIPPDDSVSLLESFTDVGKTSYTLLFVDIFLLWITKLPLYALYAELAIRKVVSKRLSYLIFSGILWHTVIFLVCLLSHIFACGRDVAQDWEINNCLGFLLVPQLVIYLVFNASSDIILMVLGTLVIITALKPRYSNRSKKHRRELIGIAFIFAIGLLSLASTIVRFGIIWVRFEDIPVNSLFEFQNIGPIFQWYGIETMTAIVACNLPSFRGLLRNYRFRTPWTRASSASATRTGESDVGSGNKTGDVGAQGGTEMSLVGGERANSLGSESSTRPLEP